MLSSRRYPERMQQESTSTREATGTSTQKSLIQRLHNWQDRKSWNAFYRTYHKLVYAVARKSGLTETEAWDTVQETFLAIARQSTKGNFDPSLGSFKSWLLRLTQWRIQDQLRKRQREAADSLPTNVPDVQGEGLDKLWEREWQQNIMRTAISRVKMQASPRQFQIYEYLILQGMKTEEVCRKLGVNRAQVYLAKHRIGSLLRQEIIQLSREEG